MTVQSISWGEDLPTWMIGVALLCLVAYLGRAARIVFGDTRLRVWLGLTQAVSGLAIALAVLRPNVVVASSTSLGARVAVLMDGSRRLQIGS
ncbi:MAG TPA: hypothetical protein VKP30_33565, partial [Polyangiaceae bacterium]|nr:hypothetical protein [Polyangiaceae bacterium]